MITADAPSDGSLRVCLVGPSTRFLSGITYYTYGLAGAIAPSVHVSVILIRRLLPRWLYPGAARVGEELTDVALPVDVPRLDGLDWYGFPSLIRAARFLRAERPDVLVLEWWTGAVLHLYLALAWLARISGSRVVIEFHEVQDPGEATHGVFTRYVKRLGPRLFRRADRYLVHTEFDRSALEHTYALDPGRTVVVPFAPWDHYERGHHWRAAPEGVCNLLFFGLIRPVKGLDDLITAFDAIPEDRIDGFWLTVVGETWEGWTEPLQMIERSRHRERITVVNRYVSDAEADAVFAGADVAVLPYRRAAQSAVLHVAMGYGLPIVVTRVGGLEEAAGNYPGAVLADADDPGSLADAIEAASAIAGTRFAADHDWGSAGAGFVRALEDVVRPGSTVVDLREALPGVDRDEHPEVTRAPGIHDRG